MKKIIVPVGNTENGINNLNYAVKFASMSGATVYLVNLYREFSKVGGLTKVNELLHEESEAQLQKIIDSVDTGDVEVLARAIKGDPFEGITRIANQLEVDLMIVSPQSIDIKDEVYLGSITGKIIKETDIPVLVIPQDYIFRKVEVILMAIKSGKIVKEGLLDPLKAMLDLFSARLNVLHVITPDSEDGDLEHDAALKALENNCTTTENATIYQGVLEHFQSNNPDMLCVIRRKRGFFQKLWETSAVMKKDFYTSKPLLILSGQE